MYPHQVARLAWCSFERKGSGSTHGQHEQAASRSTCGVWRIGCVYVRCAPSGSSSRPQQHSISTVAQRSMLMCISLLIPQLLWC